MKILFHHRTTSKDGQNVHIEELIDALRGRGHEVVLVGPGVAEAGDFGSGAGLIDALKRLLPRALYELLELAYTVVAYRRLRRAYLAHRPDVLYERYNLFLLAGRWLKARYRLPFLLEINAPLAHERGRFGGLALERLAAWSERQAWQGADYVLPVTDKLADFVRAAGVEERRIRVIQNGVNRNRFQPGSEATNLRRQLGLDGKLVLGFTGFIRSWHGLDRVVNLLAEQQGEQELHFLVVGDGPAREELEQQARRLGVADRLTLVGIVARERVADYIGCFDIALQPRVVAYASPLKIFEYMALGRAIVAPDQDNLREILTADENALLFDADDDGAFRAAILRLCREPELRARLGAAAADSIEAQDLTWDRNAARIERLFLDVGAEDRESAAD